MYVKKLLLILTASISINAHSAYISNAGVKARVWVAQLETKELVNHYRDCVHQHGKTHSTCTTIENEIHAQWSKTYDLPASIIKEHIKGIQKK